MDNEVGEIQGRLFGPTPETRPKLTSKAGRPGALRGRQQEMTEAEKELLRAIGNQVAGPRFMMDVAADPETLELLDDLVAKGLVESTGSVLRPGPLARVCLTGRGWARYKSGENSDPLTDNDA